MKQKIIISTNDTVVYKGRISDIPITEDAIIKKSIELFDDDEPCVIHQSYVIKEYVDEILTIFKNKNIKKLHLSDVKEMVDFLDIQDIEHTTITLEG